ncbi:IS66 family insertion sequence element accessory protein TnpB [Burkholderia sp. Bp9143]|uniref:IS66 family insertion sequence element accessory protein TnpB n=1 Tax=Burkholderia sp. Bp9143 TaxID=2184574 RepID=UPI0021AB6681|nr:IS66 family insertion sequence element accessory protein TnpB [Burkholderia sp. Bp9143]
MTLDTIDLDFPPLKVTHVAPNGKRSFDPDGKLHREPIDFRAGVNTLVTMVEQSMHLDPLARAVFALHNRKRDRVKLLLYDRAGFWLMLKRLEADRFVWPRREQAA